MTIFEFSQPDKEEQPIHVEAGEGILEEIVEEIVDAKVSWRELERLCPDFVAAVVACSRCTNDRAVFDNESGDQIQALRRSIRHCPWELFEQLPLVAPPGTVAGVWSFLDILLTKRPIFREHVGACASILEKSRPWLKARPDQTSVPVCDRRVLH
jgi:hypothetical protein